MLDRTAMDGGRRGKKGPNVDECPPEKLTLMLKLGVLLCRDGLTLKQAAKKLGITLSMASRRKQEAETLGIIRTKFYPPSVVGVEHQLRTSLARYGIREVNVCKDSVGPKAARYLEDRVKPGNTVVLDGGLTIRDFVYSFSGQAARDLTIIPLCADPPSYESSTYELMVVMAVKCHSMEKRTKVPYSQASIMEGERRRVRRIAERANYVFLGVGPWKRKYTASEVVRHLGHDPRKVRAKYSQVAAVCGYCALDSQGNHVPLDEIDVMPRALSFEAMQKLSASKRRRVILLAASRAKAEAVKCAILARMCNTLIIDEELGNELLKNLSKRNRDW